MGIQRGSESTELTEIHILNCTKTHHIPKKQKTKKCNLRTIAKDLKFICLLKKLKRVQLNLLQSSK